MVLTVSVAFATALSNVGIEKWRWYDAGIAIVTCQFCIGLIQQSYSIFRVNQPLAVGRLTADERWGDRFAILVRIILICAFLANYVCLVAQSNGFDVFGDDGRYYFSNSHADCHAIAILLTLLLDRQKKRPRDRLSNNRMQVVVDRLGLLMALAVVVWAAVDRTIVASLVHCGVAGVDAAMILPFDQRSSPSSYFLDCRNLLVAGSIGTALAVHNVVCFRTWLKIENRADRRFTHLRLTLGLIASTGVAVWIHRVGLPRFSPWLAYVSDWPSINRMIFAVLAVLLAGAFFVLPRLSSEVHEASRLCQANPTPFAHEWFIVKLVLLVCSIGYLYELVSYDGGLSAFVPRPYGFFRICIENLFYSPLQFAVALAVSMDIWQSFFGVDDKFNAIAAVSPSRIAVAGILGFIVVLSSAVSLTCLGFAINVFPHRLWFGF